jgi:zinc/manganese transport system substrate-binding protein
MKRAIFPILFLCAFNAKAEVLIFACEPEWASLAQIIVQDRAVVKVAMAANQNPKNVKIDRAMTAKMHDADLVFCNGGNLEEKWLPELVRRSGNAKIIDNQKRILLAYDYSETPKIPEVENIEETLEAAPAKLPNRVHLNPYNIKKIAAEFLNRIKFLDETNADFYQKTYEDFDDRWDESLKKWEKKAAMLKGMVLVANDDSWFYLAQWLGLKIISLSDPKSDGKPSSSDYYRVSDLLKTTPAEAVIFGGFEDKKLLLRLREKNKLRMVFLPFTVGGSANSNDLFWLFETIIKSLMTDCSGLSCKALIRAAPEGLSIDLSKDNILR